MKSSKITSRRQYAYEDVTPSILIPDHFVCNQETKMVVMYDVPIGDEREKITLQFPGDMVGSSPRQIATKRMGSQSVVFNTPVYSTSRGQVEVTPILETRRGYKIQMGKFRLTLKHPLTTAMELSMKLSTSSAVLPILTTLMLNASGDKEDLFKDPHTDRMMTLLVGSMKPGTSCTIKDILLPDKKWKKKHLTDLAQKFGLRNMEKEAYMLNTQRKPPAMQRRDTIGQKEEALVSAVDSSPDLFGEREAVISASFSSPTINTVGLDSDENFDNFEVDRVSMLNQLTNNAKQVYIVTRDFFAREPGKISLKVGQKIYVVTFHSSEEGWWYGACEGRHGIFPSSCVKPLLRQEEKRASRLPLPPVPRKEHSEINMRLSVPFNQRNTSPQNVHMAKLYKKAGETGHSSSSASSSKRGSQDLLNEGISSESGEYVDMEKKYATFSESDNESSSTSAEEHPSYLSQRRMTHKFQNPSPPKSPGRTKIAIPSRNVLRSTQASAQYTPQSPQPNITGPVPPTRTTSIKHSDEEYDNEFNQSEDVDSSEDDSQDYVNIDQEGLPLTKLELEKKRNYVNYNPTDFDMVQGHMYDRPDIFSPEHENPTLFPATKTVPYPKTDVTWQPDGKQLEARRHARLMGRATHENVVLPRRRTTRTPPIPPPKPTVLGTSHPTGAQSLEQPNWFKQESHAKHSQGW